MRYLHSFTEHVARPDFEALYQEFLREDEALAESEETERSGHPFTICTNVANWIKEHFFPEGTVVGFSIEDSPDARTADGCDGHDFLLLPDGTIVDFWYRNMEDESYPGYVNRFAEPEETRRLYGDPAHWHPLGE